MTIRVKEDVVAPLVVTAVDLVSEEVIPEYNQYLSYAMTGLGYLGAWLNFGGSMVKQIGVASLPLTARNIRDLVKGGGVSRRVSFRPIRNPIRQTAFDEFSNVRVS